MAGCPPRLAGRAASPRDGASVVATLGPGTAVGKRADPPAGTYRGRDMDQGRRSVDGLHLPAGHAGQPGAAHRADPPRPSAIQSPLPRLTARGSDGQISTSPPPV